MKFVCMFTDPGGNPQAFSLEADSKEQALDGLLGKCADHIEWADGVDKTTSSLWPSFIVYEDLTFDRLAKGPDPKRKDLGDVAMILEEE
jgi:hypothetical protein